MTVLRLREEPHVVDRPPGARRSARPRGIALLSVLLLLGAIVVVADRVAAEAASNELRARLGAQLSERGVGYQSIDVSIGGFPFLTQVARGRYEKISIGLAGVRLPAGESGQALLPSLDVVATGVAADGASLVRGTPTSVVAEELRGSAVVPYETLTALVDFAQYGLEDVAISGDNGVLYASGNARVGGVEVPISASGEVIAVDGQIELRLRELGAVGAQAPAVVRDFLADLAQRAITTSLPDLPFSLTLDHIRAERGGLTIRASGSGVSLVA